jgi:hypothetical protein
VADKAIANLRQINGLFPDKQLYAGSLTGNKLQAEPAKAAAGRSTLAGAVFAHLFKHN